MIDLLLYTIYGLVALTAALTLWSALRGLLGRRGASTDWGVPARRIAWLTFGALVVVLALTFVLADARPLPINGRLFADAFWLRTADMLIHTSVVLIVVAAGLALYGFIRQHVSNPKAHV